LVILGSNYKFNKLDIKYLKKEYNPIFIQYNRYISTKEVVRNLQEYLPVIEPKIIILNTKELNNEISNYLKKITKKGYKVLTIEKFLEKYTKKIYITPNSQIDIQPYNKWQYIQKRVIDYLISIPLIILTLPILIYSAYRIKKESPKGEIIFKQTRVGKNGKPFTCYKFRSMHTDTEYFDKYTQDNDPRIFKWGNVMRKTRIDELPQLINVIKGDIHLIGPRAEWIELVKDYEEKLPNYNKRHKVAPGITGWAQVNYPYGRNLEDTRQKLMYDLYYIKHWNLWLELTIVWLTIKTVINKSGL